MSPAVMSMSTRLARRAFASRIMSMTGRPTPVRPRPSTLQGAFTEVVEPSDDRRVRRIPEAFEVPHVVGIGLPLLEDRDGACSPPSGRGRRRRRTSLLGLRERVDVGEEDVASLGTGRGSERRRIREERRDVVGERPLDVDRPEELVGRVPRASTRTPAGTTTPESEALSSSRNFCRRSAGSPGP